MPETELHVIFDQPNEVFFPGQPISGRVVLSTTEEKYKARAVNIKILGLAHTSWTDYDSVRRVDNDGNVRYDSESVHYSSNVHYLDQALLLWACKDGSNELSAGDYVWPFSYTLPLNVPPSFEGKYGYLRYSVTAEVDRPWRLDKAKRRCITVSPLIDLNAIPLALTPIDDEESENLGCCFFRKGYLELRVNIPKTGFVPGETVPMNIHILNHSSVPVTEVKAKIIQQCKFIAYRNGTIFRFDGGSDTLMSGSSQQTKYDTKPVITQTQPMTVTPGNEHKFVLEFRLPSVTPTICRFSPVITVEYVVQVRVETTSTCGSAAKCEMPILIGTVPIRNYLPPPIPNNYPIGLPPPYANLTDVNVPCPSGGSGTAVIPSAPPPSYQESMYGVGGTELRAEENEKPFAPKYPVFNNLPIYNPTAPPSE
ncbi:Arrestin C-terminal-like domain-containing protein [Caenorhabditis elegans]|uniref:Arrestin C-terminal-like domain-containing protein n=1 Tax=Caenorhabditis elegans TaxID=6239 RepID=O17981_CAEEL|nr:Arrestin C-terminal-like domain-containing protein [Caenorhabditis elegans]CAB05786.2 Arrestin C-terminal-like domain-containing protein [Caenorhabditis elegans]|eukprot:NP_496883.2 ARRestin Domain protein [Caenorhabditis elegans]